MVYGIIEFDMLDGRKFYVYEEVHGVKEVKDGSYSRFVDETTGRPYQWRTWASAKLTSNLSPYKPERLFKASETKFLPYLADVTEDLPGSVRGKFPPQTWKGCKLLSEKHNGYMEFYHEPTGKTLRIAMNSNTYKPAK